MERHLMRSHKQNRFTAEPYGSTYEQLFSQVNLLFDKSAKHNFTISLCVSLKRTSHKESQQ